MENFGKFCFFILIMIATVLMNGYVLVKLWGWFIVTTFHTTPLTILQCIGLSIMIAYTRKVPLKKKDEEFDIKNVWEGFVRYMIFAGLTLLFGSIVTYFM